MGVTVATVRAACNTATGDQNFTTTDLGGLTPKAVILIVTRATADGSAASGAGSYIYFFDGTNKIGSWFEEADAQASSASYMTMGSTRVMEVGNGSASGTLDGYAISATFITNGVTITWSDALSSAFLLTAIFFAGTDLSVLVGSQALGTGTSGLDITSVGFEADDVITLLGAVASNQHGFGFVHNDRAGTVTQRSTNYRSRSARPTMENQAVTDDDCGLVVLANTAIQSKIVFSAFDSSGFTVTPSASALSHYLIFLALRYGSTPVIASKVYTFSTPTGTGDNTDTGPGFQPQAVLYGLSLLEAVNTIDTGSFSYSGGLAAITANAQYCNVVSSEDNVADSNTQSLSDNQAINHPLISGSAGLAATFSAFTSSGVTLNWSDIETAGKKYIAIAFQEYAAPTGGQPTMIRTQGVPTGAGRNVRPGGWN